MAATESSWNEHGMVAIRRQTRDQYNETAENGRNRLVSASFILLFSQLEARAALDTCEFAH